MKMIKLLFLLVVSVGCFLFVFSSCNLGGGKSSGTTGCQHDWGEAKTLSDATCVKAGVKIYTCSICGEKKTEEIPPNGQHRLSDDKNDKYIVTAPTATTDGEQCQLCVLCGAEQRTALKYATYQKRMTAADTANAAFTDSQFGGSSHTKMSTSAYSKPTAYPTKGQHPRLLFTAADLDALRTTWHDPDYYSLVKLTIQAGASKEDGILGTAPSGGSNHSQGVLNTIVRKAFLYQFTGVDVYGYEAIVGAKNYLITLDIQGGYGNQERYYGEVMFYMALVYDWCNDLLTATDKAQLISGVEHLVCSGKNATGKNKMEMGFPPSGQDGVTGHGCERQLLRDYLSFALAIYDDEPSWYEYIGGRFFQDFVPVRNEYYKSGYSPQGISVYMSLRYTADLWSAWLMKTATGTIPYNSANMQKVMHSVFARIVDGKNVFFEEGDDEARTHAENLKQFSLPAQISAYLFDDDTIAAWAKYSGYSYTPDLFQFLLRTGTPEPAADRYDGLDLLLYNGGYLSTYIAHSGWTENDVTIQMKIGNRTTSNHDHADSGSFQIYYKGLLAGDSGFYDTYNSTHHKQYHQATIAHNSIVIYRLNSSGTVSTTYQQKQPGEAGSFSTWSSSTYDMAVTTGYACGYADQAEKTPVYAYIAGDLAKAYDVASEVTRRMLTVFDTGRDDVKAYFFVFDHITVPDTYKACQKTFLLHTVTAPTIDEANKTVTVVSGNGKLVLQSVVGGDKIVGIGGAGKNYYLNNAQCATKNGEDDGYWGRVEISPKTGNRTDTMLNVMYVCDKTADITLPASKIETSDVTGSVIGNTAAVFVTSATARTTAFTFTATGSGDLNYYISGVKAGNWMVTAGSQTLIVTATVQGKLLTFTAPAGQVTLTPQ